MLTVLREQKKLSFVVSFVRHRRFPCFPKMTLHNNVLIVSRDYIRSQICKMNVHHNHLPRWFCQCALKCAWTPMRIRVWMLESTLNAHYRYGTWQKKVSVLRPYVDTWIFIRTSIAAGIYARRFKYVCPYPYYARTYVLSIDRGAKHRGIFATEIDTCRSSLPNYIWYIKWRVRDYPFVSLDEFVDPDFRCCVPFFGQAARNLNVTLSQTPVEENSLLHVIRVHHLQLLSHSLMGGKYIR